MKNDEMNGTTWSTTVLLSDFAQVADGKLYVLGGGWSLCGPGAFQHALAIKIEVPWDESNRAHKLEAILHDEDNKQGAVGTPPSPVRFEGTFEVGRPAGLPPGTPLDFPLAVNLGLLQLPPGKGYVWMINVDGHFVGKARFRTRPS